jgi:hypothetical protein
MKTYSFVQITVCALLLTALAGPAQAQSRDREDISGTPVIVTPFLSLGDPLSSRVGTAITFPVTETVSVEAELGYRRAELNALSAHVSAFYDLPQWRRITPYLAAGAGLEQYGTALEQPDGTLATQARTAFSINAGGGVKVPVNDDWGFAPMRAGSTASAGRHLSIGAFITACRGVRAVSRPAVGGPQPPSARLWAISPKRSGGGRSAAT